MNKSVIVYDAVKFEEVFSIHTGEREGYNAVAFSPDGSRVAVSGRYAGTHVFSTATGERLHEIPTVPHTAANLLLGSE